MRILFLLGTSSGPAARFRVLQFVPYLKNIGHEVDVHVTCPERTASPRMRNRQIRSIEARISTMLRIASLGDVFFRAPKYDVIMMNRDMVPEPNITFLEPWLARLNSHLIFDFDDAIHLSRDSKMRRILPHFCVVTPGNEYLANYVREIHSNVKIWPTAVDTDYYRIKSFGAGPVRIGWSGSLSSSQVDLPQAKPFISRLAQLIDFEFVVISNVDPKIDWPGVKVKFVQWTPETEVVGLHNIDIGIMPLQDSPFQRGKCSLKAIQYMANGIPAVVSPVGANQTTVIHGSTGFHAKDEYQWIEYIQQLARDVALRKSMGQAARAHVEANYSIRSLLPQMLNTFEAVSQA